ncbi:hypothetical protein EDB86DRAFT_3107867 [Lactarius hatsudake]|nr:hypothetical protein EDB86DRAFT_3107867 [Lactarius hatsudake]
MRDLPARRSARRPPLCAAERVSRRDRRALDGLRQRAREGSAASSVVGVGGKLYAIGLDWSLYQHCPGFDECTREEIYGSCLMRRSRSEWRWVSRRTVAVFASRWVLCGQRITGYSNLEIDEQQSNFNNPRRP